MEKPEQKRIFSKIFLNIILLIVFFLLLMPSFFLNIHFVNQFRDILMVGTLIILLFLNILLIKKFNIYIILVVIFLLWRLISSYYLSESISDLVNLIVIINVVLFTNISIKYFPKTFLRAGATVSILYLMLNFISVISFPLGLLQETPRPNVIRSIWIYGNKNNFIYFLIPSLMLILLYEFYNKGKVSLISFTALFLGTLTVILTNSATAVVIYFIFMILIILGINKSIRKKITSLSLSIVYIIIWLLIVRVNSFPFIETLVVDTLNRDLTFSGRTRIWNNVFTYVNESIIYGFGINHQLLVSYTYFGAHNQFLQLVLESGLVGLVLLICILIICGTKLFNYRAEFSSYIILISLFSILVAGLMEAYSLNLIFLIITLGVMVGSLSKSSGGSKNVNYS